MKRIYAFAIGAAVVTSMTIGALHLSAGDKVLVCHVEGPHSGRAHVIDISINAVAKHLAHGDSLEATVGLHAGDDCDVSDTVPSLN